MHRPGRRFRMGVATAAIFGPGPVRCGLEGAGWRAHQRSHVDALEAASAQGTVMEQLRLSLPPRDAANPLSRLVFGLLAVILGVGALAVLLFVALPLAGIIVSAAVGGMILALAGVVMMIPFLLLAATVLLFMSRSGARRHAGVRSEPLGR